MSSQRFAFIALSTLIVIAGCVPATRQSTVPHSSSATVSSGTERERIAAAYNAESLSMDRRTLLRTAESWLGATYRYGGNTREGVDCSGFVCYMYRTIDHKLPRTSRDQSTVGELVSIDEAQPGDLVFFNTSGSGVSHVGMLISTREFVHASTARGVIVSGLDEKYYRERIVSMRRVLADGLVGSDVRRSDN